MQPEVETGDVAAPAASPPDAAVEALLFASEQPLAAARLAQIVGARKGEVLEAVDRLNVFYAESRRSFRIVPLAGGFQLVTTPEHADVVTRLHKDRVASKLSRAALETLAIVAFKQPVTRAEIDVIRGVSASDGVIRHLMERSLVRIAGRAEAPGRPLLYGTTREFLAHFGLQAVSDLPRTDELAALLRGAPQPSPEEEAAWAESHSGQESDEDDGVPPAQ
jgi:segregation and condensation protein B